MWREFNEVEAPTGIPTFDYAKSSVEEIHNETNSEIVLDCCFEEAEFPPPPNIEILDEEAIQPLERGK